MITKEEFLKALETINKYKVQVNAPYYEMVRMLDKNALRNVVITKETLLKDADFSVRNLNILRSVTDELGMTTRFDEISLGHFEGVKKNDIFRCRNLGKKSFIEIEKVFFEAGIIF